MVDVGAKGGQAREIRKRTVVGRSPRGVARVVVGHSLCRTGGSQQCCDGKRTDFEHEILQSLLPLIGGVRLRQKRHSRHTVTTASIYCEHVAAGESNSPHSRAG